MTVPPVEPEPPVTLYKYLAPERIEILAEMQLRFSPPSEFNDTFDSDYLVPKSQGAAGIVARSRLKRSIGVLCLTEEPDNHLMWVNYAKNHTGLVMGFDAHAPFFGEDGRTSGKVNYQSRPNVLPEAGLDACFFKSKDWEYEKEWRCVRSFQSSESRLVTIEPSLVTHVIFGSRMETWQIARIMQYTTAQQMQLRFLLSTPSRKSWRFESRSKEMSVCSACDGDGYLMEDSKTKDSA
jgi:hypothetical protein